MRLSLRVPLVTDTRGNEQVVGSFSVSDDSVCVDAHIVDEHLGWEGCRGIWRSGPVAADGEIEKNEIALAGVERPRRAT